MPSKQLTVSVVMCTHNGMEFVQEQLESILSQTRIPDELIISDDNSTDGTLIFAKDFVEKRMFEDPHLSHLIFRTLRNVPALGVTKNFENAISFSQSDLIALCDQDDIWVMNRLEIILKEFESDPDLALIHSDALLVNEQNASLNLTLFESLRVSSKEIELINSSQALSVFLRRNLVTGATTVFKKELLNTASPFPQQLLHDEWLGLVASSTGERIKAINKPLIRYRQHSQNQVGASKLGVRHAIGRVLHPGKRRNEILLARAEAICSHPHLNSNVQTSVKVALQDKLEHEVTRSNYPTSRLKRVPRVIKEVKTGRYSKFGLGLQDIVRDFIQPLA